MIDTPSTLRLALTCGALAVGGVGLVAATSSVEDVAARDVHAAHAGAPTAARAVTTHARTVTVRVRDDVFSPKRLTVRRGTTVRWVWQGRMAHNVRVRSGPARFDSGLRTTGRYRRTLTRRGTYRIVCDPHLALGMTMTIVVR